MYGISSTGTSIFYSPLYNKFTPKIVIKTLMSMTKIMTTTKMMTMEMTTTTTLIHETIIKLFQCDSGFSFMIYIVTTSTYIIGIITCFTLIFSMTNTKTSKINIHEYSKIFDIIASYDGFIVTCFYMCHEVTNYIIGMS